MAVFLGAIDSKLKGIIVAKSKINQKNIDKAIYYNDISDKLNDEVNRAYDMGDERLEKKLYKQYENAYEKYLNFLYMLPMTERKRVERYTTITKYK